MRTSIRLIVGLGNPGREYADTRHNIGYRVIEAFAAEQSATWRTRSEFGAQLARLPRNSADESDLFLLKPLTYMNESGRSVAAFCRYHRFAPQEVVAIYDECNLPFGRTKLSITGSAGGHNGVASLLEHLGNGFRRFRIGIGPRQPPAIDLKDYVLGKLTPEQQIIFQNKLPEYLAGLNLLLQKGVAEAMNQLNRRTASDDGN